MTPVSISWTEHLIVLPIVLPLLAGALMTFFDEQRRNLKFAISMLSATSLLIVACVLLYCADGRGGNARILTVGVYAIANWPAPFGITLVLDRLTAIMLLLSAVLALTTLISSVVRWDRIGVHYYTLFQFLLMGLNGAFLTTDLFNLFVFFEVMLAASYGLVLHGSSITRVRAGLHYIVINLVASSIFLIGVSLLYSVTGTLNMADMADKVATVQSEDRVLLEIGAAVLGIAFLLKSAMWPLNFWLPSTYGAAIAPVAAIFSIMTKVGIYVLLRLWTMFFAVNAGDSLGFGQDWLLYGGLATLTFGSIGIFASQDIKRLASFSIIISSGILLTTIGYGDVGVVAAALFYMLTATLAVSAFYLLGELMERDRAFGADILALTLENFEVQGSVNLAEREEIGVAIPAALAFLGLSFIACTLLLTGMPPLSGFIAKFAMLSAMIRAGGPVTMAVTGTTLFAEPGWLVWLGLVLIIVSGLAGLIAMVRVGVRSFWAANRSEPRLRVVEVSPIVLLLTVCLAMTIRSEVVMSYLGSAAMELIEHTNYSRDILSVSPQPSPTQKRGQ